MENCKCCSGKAYKECCEPLITGSRKAETAEELLRSRYYAYATTEIDYIFNTIHPSNGKNLINRVSQTGLKNPTGMSSRS